MLSTLCVGLTLPQRSISPFKGNDGHWNVLYAVLKMYFLFPSYISQTEYTKILLDHLTNVIWKKWEGELWHRSLQKAMSHGKSCHTERLMSCTIVSLLNNTSDYPWVCSISSSNGRKEEGWFLSLSGRISHSAASICCKQRRRWEGELTNQLPICPVLMCRRWMFTETHERSSKLD